MDSKAIIPQLSPSARRRLTSLARRVTSHHHSTSKGRRCHGDVEVWKSIVAGSIAGITSTMLFYPLDVLRTKRQSSGSRCRLPLKEFWKNTIHHGGGFRALYTGLSLPLSAQAVYKATLFTVNNASQTFLLEWKRQEYGNSGYQLTMQDQFMCGAMGGAVNAALFVTPVEFVRNQLIAQHTNNTGGGANSFSKALGPIHILRRTLYKKGIVGLWRGATITVARDSVGWGFSFYMFHSCKGFLQSRYHDKESFSITLISGAVAGLSFWSVALPMDTVKTLVQNGTASSARDAVRQSLHTLGPWRTMLRFCRAWQFAFAKGVPAAAVTLGTYDVCYRALHHNRL